VKDLSFAVFRLRPKALNEKGSFQTSLAATKQKPDYFGFAFLAVPGQRLNDRTGSEILLIHIKFAGIAYKQRRWLVKG
jgi:hypothetical protein